MQNVVPVGVRNRTGCSSLAKEDMEFSVLFSMPVM